MFNISILSVSNVIKYSIFCVILTMVNVNTANAHDHKKMNKESPKPLMTIKGAWSRALPPVVPNGAAYLTLHNMGNKSDTLLSVSSSIAKHSMLHESYLSDEKVAMRHIEQLKVDAGQRVEFKPGGYHIMLMGLKQPLSVDTTFKLTLEFKNAGMIEVPITVIDSVIEQKTSKSMSHNH